MDDLTDVVLMWQIIAGALLCLLIMLCFSFNKLVNKYIEVLKSRNAILKEYNLRGMEIFSLKKQIKK